MTKMKDSGVKWIGQIPEDWETKPIRHLMIERNEKNEYLQTTTMLSLSAKEGVTLYSEEGHTGNRPREDLSGYKVVRVGDIVVNSMNILSGAVGLSKYDGCVSPVYYTYFARDGYDIDFLNLVFQCKQFQLNLKGLGNGILIKESENGTLNTIRMRIPSDKLLKEEFPVCSLEKQKKIVEVLGVQCKKIDELIAIQEKEIEKLKEYKISVITKAVTKGLDETVQMKDSGIDWIGQIPSHWKVGPLKYNLKEKMIYGANESGVEYSEEFPRYIRITDITGDNKLKDIDKLSLTFEQAKPFILQEGDVLFARSGGTVGKTFIYKEKYGLAAFAGYLICARCGKTMLPEFLYYWTLSNSYLKWTNRIFIQSTIQNIGANKYENMEICRPTIDEQKEIIKFLNNYCKEFDKILLCKQQKIEKLQEYKKSLIYEYVTGKKEV